MKQRSCFLIVVALLTLCGCNDTPPEQPTILQRETTRRVMLTEFYLGCGHIRDLGEETRSSAETEADLHARYPDFEIAELAETHAKLTRYQKGKCDGHILFREYRGKIGVFRENSGALLDIVDVSVASLREQDQKLLKDGVSVFGKEEQAAFLDDFAS